MRMRIHNQERIKRQAWEALDRQVNALEQRLTHVQDDLRQLDVRLLHHLRDDSYTTKLVLHIPDRDIAAHGDGPGQPIAIKEAFDRLIDQLEEYMSKLRREHFIRDEQRKPAWQTPPGVPIAE